MNTSPTYREMFAAAREQIAKNIEDYPLEWRDPEHFNYVLWSLVQPKLIPEDADWRWALSILKERPDLVERNAGDHTGNILDCVLINIEGQLTEELREEFQSEYDRLADPNFDEDVDRIDGLVQPPRSIGNP